MRPRASEWLLAVWAALLAAAKVVADSAPRAWSAGGVQPVLALALVAALALALRLLGDGLRAARAAWRAARQGGPWPAAAGFEAERRRLDAAAPWLRCWLVLALGALTYPASEFAIRALRGETTFDPLLAALDLELFGLHASVALETFVSPGLTALLRAAYFSHLLVPPLVLAWFAARRPHAEFARLVDEVVTLSLLGTLLYVAVPATGPYRELAALYTLPLAGGPLSQWSREAIEALRVPRDAFPSLHVALSGLCLWRLAEVSRGGAALLLPLVLGNWAGTLYLRYHYVVDVVAGLLLIPCAVIACRRLATGEAVGGFSLPRPSTDGREPGR